MKLSRRLVLSFLAVCGCAGGKGDALDMSLGSESRPDATIEGRDATAPDAEPDGSVEPDLARDGGDDPDAARDGGDELTPRRVNAEDCRKPAPYAALSTADAGLPAEGLRLWLRADTGVWLDAEGRVCAWDDQSGWGHDLYQDDPGVRPIGVRQLGGEPAVDLDPTQYVARDDVLGIAATSGRSIVAVYALDDPSARFGIVQGQTTTNWTWLGIDDNTFVTAGNLYGCYLPSVSYDTDVMTTTDARLRSLVIASLQPGQPLGASFRCRMAGADLTSRPTVAVSSPLQDFSGADTTRVGWGLGNPGDARVAEVLLYDRALSDTELSQVERAIAERYGL